ncbi:MAG TPA: ankyrin repeat domain-containing protein, partial [Gemmatimonadaceae bacterium]|nr:ankyrin repeat domain-containing protein [Gemmatimonadaceae bacterium]
MPLAPALEGDARAEFINAACVPLDRSHASGDLEAAEAILESHPEIATSDIHTAAILGDYATVRRFLDADPANATVKSAPRGWDALTHLCFSRYLRIGSARPANFVSAAQALLDAGADPNTGFFSNEHQPTPERETALYGAAGIAHHAGLTRLLLERGADPNDGEVAYHSPEGFDNEALKVLVASGRLTPDTLATMLVRKLDWTDHDGAAFLLQHGADPNYVSHWGNTALNHSIDRDNSLRFIELLLDYGADPMQTSAKGESAFDIAARMGRGDVLDLFDERAFAVGLDSMSALLVACARGDAARVHEMAERDPALLQRLKSDGGQVLIDFAGAG